MPHYVFAATPSCIPPIIFPFLFCPVCVPLCPMRLLPPWPCLALSLPYHRCCSASWPLTPCAFCLQGRRGHVLLGHCGRHLPGVPSPSLPAAEGPAGAWPGTLREDHDQRLLAPGVPRRRLRGEQVLQLAVLPPGEWLSTARCACDALYAAASPRRRQRVLSLVRAVPLVLTDCVACRRW